MINLETTQTYKNRVYNKETLVNYKIKYIKFFPKRLIWVLLHQVDISQYEAGKASLGEFLVLHSGIYVYLRPYVIYKHLRDNYQRLMRPVRRRTAITILKPQDFLLSLNVKIINYD